MDSKIINPFPGLRPFEEDEEHLFFGRETQIDDLSSKLSENHFLAVIGSSGSGKSSLVKSGLIPVLHSGLCSGVGHGWRVGVFRPGDNPIKNLANCFFNEELLGHIDSEDKDSLVPIIETTLRRSDFGLRNVHEQLFKDVEENILIVVDQFEELFRFSNLEKQSGSVKRDADAFINLLLRASENKNQKLYIAITMRSDFLGDCTVFRGLPEAINQGQYLIPRMSREERKLAITGPIAVAGVNISSRLVTKLLNDVGESPDHLPILQHALMRTFNAWKYRELFNEEIDLDHYEVIGTMDSALSLHAEEAFSKLKDKQKQICEALFKALTEKGENGRGIRRPTKLSGISSIINEPIEKIIPVIDVFREVEVSFLMPPAEIDMDADSIIDISHESLMRVWERLISWVNEEVESAEIYLRLSEAAIFHAQGKSALWRDPELQLAVNWQLERNPNESWASRYNSNFKQAISFLQQSSEQKSAQEEEKILKEKAGKRRTRIFLFFISIGFLFSSVFAYQSYLSKKTAEKAEEKSILLKVKAENAAENAVIAKQIADENAEIAKQQSFLARENEARALEQKMRAENQEKIALSNEAIAIKLKGVAETEKKAAELARKEAENQREIANESEIKARSEEAKATKLKNIEQAKRWLILAEKYAATNPIFSGKLALKAYEVLNYNGSVKESSTLFGTFKMVIQNIRPKNHFSKMFNNKSNLRTIAVAGNDIYIASSNGHITHYDNQSKSIKKQVVLENELRTRTILSTASNQLILGDVKGSFFTRDRENLEKKANFSNGERKLNSHKSTVKDAIILNDSTIISISFDSTIKLTRLNTGEIIQLRKSSKYWGLTASKEFFIAANSSNQLEFFTIQNGGETATYSHTKDLNFQNQSITAIKYFHAKNLLIIGTSRGALYLYDILQSKFIFEDLKSHNSLITSISQKEDLVLTTSYDTKVILWNFNEVSKYKWQKIFHSHKDQVYAASFIGENSVLSIGKRGGFIWNYSIEELYKEIKKYLNGNTKFSEEEITKYELFYNAQ